MEGAPKSASKSAPKTRPTSKRVTRSSNRLEPSTNLNGKMCHMKSLKLKMLFAQEAHSVFTEHWTVTVGGIRR